MRKLCCAWGAVGLPFLVWSHWLLVGASPSPAPAEEDHSNETRGGSKKCAGRYKGGVVNLCPDHWPDAKAEKIWFILFYAPFCGHCQALEPKYIELAKTLREEDAGIGIGAVDCNEVLNQGLCTTKGVRGYPTMMAMVMGKPKPYHGAREFKTMKSWILGVKEAKGTKGGSSKCEAGIFKSKVRDAVVPLCETHFPEDNAKNAWIIIFYDENSPQTDFRDGVNQAAIHLGNEPPDRAKALRQEQIKRRDRLTELEQRYPDLPIELPEKGPFGNEPLAKIGAVCCDCSEEVKEFCGRTLGDRRSDPLPLKVYVDKGKKDIFDGDGLEAQSMVEFALQQLSFLGKPEHTEEL